MFLLRCNTRAVKYRKFRIELNEYLHMYTPAYVGKCFTGSAGAKEA